MAELYPSIAQCAVITTAFKVLLFPAYKSTDFEVHRNWLAITHSLPPWEWYYEETSRWTLDYPPFFAYFEWILSQFAKLVDPEMLRVYHLDYDSWQTVYFQRFSVIISELVLVYALYVFGRFEFASTHERLISWQRRRRKLAHTAALSILLSPGLLIIDHVHFQYNGFLYGILVLSLILARHKSTILLSGLLFAVLLCLKHIYMYIAPAYFVYLLRVYCLSPRSIFDIQIGNTIKLGVGVLAIFGAIFGPFIYWGQTQQVLTRLFPFSRGLCHTYWAPNIWALYSFIDRILIPVAPKLHLPIAHDALNSVTRGLSGDSTFAVLPAITPFTTFLLTQVLQLPALLNLFFDPTHNTFLATVTFTAYTSFLFGWHVHEKAILLILLPSSLLLSQDQHYLSALRPLFVSAHLSLFPLLFTPAEFFLKTSYTLFWLVLFLPSFDRLATHMSSKMVFMHRLGDLYIGLSVPLVLYCSVVHRFVWGAELEFLPLMLMSVYCAVGVVGSWLGFGVVYWRFRAWQFRTGGRDTRSSIFS